MPSTLEQNTMLPDILVEPEVINGFLWIGDQHLGTRRPERRFNDYNDRILAKLQHAVDIANEKRLVPLFAGDLFHHAREEDDGIKTAVMEMLGDCWVKPIFNIGNHDKRGLMLSKKDSLSVIASSKLITIPYSTGPVAQFKMPSGRTVLVGASPYDMPIPDDVAEIARSGLDVIWMTHHDMAFDGVYPGATELHEIKGCRFVLNGHMHLHRDPTPVGSTLWCNFGSITRTAIDAIHETPSVWEMNEDTFKSSEFIRHELPHQPGPVAFDMTGRLVEAQTAVHGLADLKPSAFIEILRGDMNEAQANVEQNGLYIEELEAMFDKMNLSPEMRAALIALHNAVDQDGMDIDPVISGATAKVQKTNGMRM